MSSKIISLKLQKDRKDRFNTLYNQHAERLFRYAFFLVKERTIAEDITQQVFIKAWEKLDDIRVHEELPYLMTSVKNLVINFSKKQQRKQQFDNAFKLKSINHITPLFEMEVTEFQSALEEAINQLTEAQREVFLLNRIEGMKYREIAETLSISQKAVEKRMSQALAFLRDKIKLTKW